MVERSPEKAGVGGSTPSLATMFSKDLGQSRSSLPSPLSVRIHERRGLSLNEADYTSGIVEHPRFRREGKGLIETIH